ncbi:MAG: uroporphyrinogen decarboxylase family protein, partial [Alphaproteobacteria bacterium]|nr:uroporphyrinogen decarboxylase family protein [Alphaproteobacteria bacterium]
GVDAISLDTSVPVDWAARTSQPECVTQGNLDPLAVLAGGPAMEEQARAILKGFAGGPHIFNLGHGFVPETPPEHVARLVELLKEEQS